MHIRHDMHIKYIIRGLKKAVQRIIPLIIFEAQFIKVEEKYYKTNKSV